MRNIILILCLILSGCASAPKYDDNPDIILPSNEFQDGIQKSLFELLDDAMNEGFIEGAEAERVYGK